jgi:hypothetical protein
MPKLFLSILIFILFLTQSIFSTEIPNTILGLKDIPSEIKYKGNLNCAFKYIDKTGENIVIYSSTNNYKIAEVFVYRYLKTNKTFSQIWKIYDFEEASMELELEAVFIKNTFLITDLNSNGVSEIWAMYRKVFRSDISPSTLKIIMYEGNKKYAMRGTTTFKFLINNNKEYSNSWGSYTFDFAFKQGDTNFRRFAKKLWKDNYLE